MPPCAVRGMRRPDGRTMWARSLWLGVRWAAEPSCCRGCDDSVAHPRRPRMTWWRPPRRTPHTRGAPRRRRFGRRRDPCDPPAGRRDAVNVSPGFGRQALEKRRFSLTSPASPPRTARSPAPDGRLGSQGPAPDGHPSAGLSLPEPKIRPHQAMLEVRMALVGTPARAGPSPPPKQARDRSEPGFPARRRERGSP